jgi:RND family efflux transporter MFP subunit
VKAGDLLFVIDPRPFQADFEHAQALRQQAETRLELARTDLKRAEGLRAAKAISEEEYDTRRNAVQEIEAGVAAAKAAEMTARINLDYTQIKAPISGKIGRRMVTPGNFVQLQGNGGATVLATIVTQQPIYCYFDAQEQVFLQYTRNGAERGALPCELGLVDEEGFPHHGTVDFVDNQVDPRTGTIRMRAVFANADRALIPGLFANVRVPAGPPVEALLIPSVAIQSDQGHKFVFVANKDGVAEARPVKTGRQHGEMRAILGGLAATDRVVVDGLIMVRPGAKLEVRTAAEAAVAAAKMAAGPAAQ